MAVGALLISVVALLLAGLAAGYARRQAVETGVRLAQARDQAAETARHLVEVRGHLDEVRQGMSELEAQALQTARLREVVLRDRHELLAPQFDVILSVAEGDPGALRPRLRLHLVGPRGLDRLDAVTVTVRDAPAPGDADSPGTGHADGPGTQGSGAGTQDDGRADPDGTGHDVASEAAPDAGDGSGRVDGDGSGAGGHHADRELRTTPADLGGHGPVHGPYRFPPGADGADPFGRTVAPVPLETDEWHVLQLERTPAPDDYPGGEQAWQEAYPPSLPVRLLLHCERDGYQPWDLSVEAVPVRHR